MKSILYLARIVNKESIGIIRKVKSTIHSFQDAGFDSKYIIVEQGAILGSLKVALHILTTKMKIIILRSDHHTMIVMFLPMLIARLRGKSIVIDVATPVCVAEYEIDGSRSTKLVKFIKRCLLKISFPLCFYPATRVIEYADESPRFINKVENKVVQTGNGIHVHSILFRNIKPPYVGNTIHLVAVAHLAYWHGYDILIRSISEYYKSERSPNIKINIKFTVVGDGFELQSLKALVNELGLETNVIFTGSLDGDELASCLEDKHVAVCALGLFRKNLFTASELKARDYTARGIPFLMAAKDSDFEGEFPFIFRVSNDGALIDLYEVISWYEGLDMNYGDYYFMREYASNNLDYSVKINNYIV